MANEVLNNVIKGEPANETVKINLEGAPMDVPSHAIPDLSQRIEHDARMQGFLGQTTCRLLRGHRSS